jgi:hypothetical protein
MTAKRRVIGYRLSVIGIDRQRPGQVYDSKTSGICKGSF